MRPDQGSLSRRVYACVFVALAFVTLVPVIYSSGISKHQVITYGTSFNLFSPAQAQKLDKQAGLVYPSQNPSIQSRNVTYEDYPGQYASTQTATLGNAAKYMGISHIIRVEPVERITEFVQTNVI